MSASINPRWAVGTESSDRFVTAVMAGAVGLWLAAAPRTVFEGLVFGWGLLFYLPPWFWIGLISSLVCFSLARTAGVKWLAISAIGLYVIGTLATAVPLGVMHDSVVNAASFRLPPAPLDSASRYESSYPLLAGLTTLLDAAGLSVLGSGTSRTAVDARSTPHVSRFYWAHVGSPQAYSDLGRALGLQFSYW